MAGNNVDASGDSAVIAVTAQSCVRELMTNPLWFWWLKHPDLLVEQL